MDLVLLFPGQGSQRPGMGKDLAAAFPAAHDVFAEVDSALGVSLSALCFDGPVEELTLTQNAQPALLAHGAAVWAVLAPELAPALRAAAGHSLGEFTAYRAAGTFSLSDAAVLVRQRGELMAEAGAARPGAMAAILGQLSRPIDDICAEASSSPEGGLVVPANYNSPTQVVISGEVAGVELAMELVRPAGAKRAVRLSVSGAFHSPLMAPARDAFARVLSAVSMHDPVARVYANVTGRAVEDAATARALLIEQLTSPVQWLDTMTALVTDYSDALFVELGPGSVLTTLLRRAAPAARVLPCGTATEVDAVLNARRVQPI